MIDTDTETDALAATAEVFANCFMRMTPDELALDKEQREQVAAMCGGIPLGHPAIKIVDLLDDAVRLTILGGIGDRDAYRRCITWMHGVIDQLASEVLEPQQWEALWERVGRQQASTQADRLETQQENDSHAN